MIDGSCPRGHIVRSSIQWKRARSPRMIDRSLGFTYLANTAVNQEAYHSPPQLSKPRMCGCCILQPFLDMDSNT
eukprot:scaffold6195_cov428-Prasinococcus_capsulatus_cf.AAC.3